MSFSEYKSAKVGHVYGTFSVPRAPLTAAQRLAANDRAKDRRAAYRDPAEKAAWKAATSASRSAAARARGRPPGAALATTKGYFQAHAADHGLTVSKEAVQAVNKLLAGERRRMIHAATAAAVSDGAGAVLSLHVAQALGAPPGLRFGTRKAPVRGL